MKNSETDFVDRTIKIVMRTMERTLDLQNIYYTFF